MIYYTSDHHFGHANIIKYANRTWCQHVTDMNEKLVDIWNSTITDGDEVWHLGDVYFRDSEYLKQLKGIKYLLLGNHDQKNKNTLKNYFQIINNDIYVDNKNQLVLCHYPIHDWPHKYHNYIHLHGHSHGTVKYDYNAVDVGVDCWNGFPITLNQIRNRIAIRKATGHFE